MKNSIPVFNLLSALMIGVLLASCSSSLSYQQAMDKNRKSLETTDQLDDAKFLVEAQSFYLLENEMSKLALEKGYSANIVDFAKRDLITQKDLSKDLSKLSKKEDFVLPVTMKDEHLTLLEDLRSTSRSEFDQRFVEVLDRVNDENTALFEEQSAAAHSTEVRTFAARQLGVLRQNAKDLAKVDDQLMRR